MAFNKHTIIHLAGPSCSGKSSVAESLSGLIPDIYLVSYDKQKWQLGGYDRTKHSKLVKKVTLGLFETVCKLDLPLQMDFGFSDQEEFCLYEDIAKNLRYKFVFVVLSAPREILIK